MSAVKDGFEFLDMLRERSGEKAQTFDAFSRYLEEKARKEGVPLHGQLELTPLCNFDCKMCYVHLSAEQMNGRILTVGQWKDLIRQAWEAGMIEVTLTGGECLTYPGFKDLFLYLHSLGCQVRVMTNGALIDDEWVSFFKAHVPEEIQITLYGSTEDAYEKVTGSRSLHMVLRHIRQLQDADLPVTLTVTPSRFLGADVFDTIRLAHGLYKNVKINTNLFSPKQETGRSGQEDDIDTDEYIRIFRFLAKLNGRELTGVPADILPETSIQAADKNVSPKPGILCGGGRSTFTISWKGTMMPCSMLDGITAYPLENGFAKSWTEVNEAVNRFTGTLGCAECAYVDVCNNCAAYVMQLEKSGRPRCELCEQTIQYVLSGVRKNPECG